MTDSNLPAPSAKDRGEGAGKPCLLCGTPSGPYPALAPSDPLGGDGRIGGGGGGGDGLEQLGLLTNDLAAHSGVLCSAGVYRSTLHYDILGPNQH